jgi:hypothetical protein
MAVFKENVLVLRAILPFRIIQPYLRKMLLRKDSLAVLMDNMAVFKESLVCKDNTGFLS